MEVWDAYKEDETLAGMDLIRGEKIPEGLYHGVSEIFVLHKDGTVLLMQRDYDKPNYPGLFESGAGGSILKGETFLEGAIRELREETGIDCKDLKSIYSVKSDDTIYKGYLCVVSVDKNSIVLQNGETIAYKWITKKEFLDFYKSDLFVDVLGNRLSDFIENCIKE
jgi:8-oxo-dGTP diphosphatase